MNTTIFKFVLGYAAIDFICTMVNRYVFKEKDDEKDAKE